LRKDYQVQSYQEKVGQCFLDAARRYGINVWLLWGIAKVESGFNPYAVNKNRNGSYDIGLMQINSLWIPVLKERGFIDDVEDLYDPCRSVYVGAWILSQCIRDYGYTWRAVGCYHSRHPVRGMRYAWKVKKAIAMEMKRAEMRTDGR